MNFPHAREMYQKTLQSQEQHINIEEKLEDYLQKALEKAEYIAARGCFVAYIDIVEANPGVLRNVSDKFIEFLQKEGYLLEEKASPTNYIKSKKITVSFSWANPISVEEF